MKSTGYIKSHLRLIARSTVYFKEGKWSIVDNESLFPYSYMQGFSAVQHQCKIYWRAHVTNPINIWKVDVPICSKCHEQVPESIMGLWTLHNWDTMHEKNSQKEQWVARPGQVWEYTPGSGQL